MERRDGDNSPIVSASSFEDIHLPDELVRAAYMCKFVKPSKIQASSIPLLQKGEHLIAQAQSGTGKTAAFVLAMLQAIDYKMLKTQVFIFRLIVCDYKAIVLVPTRELARQVVGVIRELGQFTKVKVQAAIPEVRFSSLEEQRKFEANFPPDDPAYQPFNPNRPMAHIVVGTPGRTGDIIKRRKLDASHVKMLVLDEADHMLDFQGLSEQSLNLTRLLPSNVQKILFSATWREPVLTFAQRFVGGNCNRITLKMNEVAVRCITQFYMDCRDNEHRFELLVSLYGVMTVSQSIIFVQRRKDADEIAARMTERHHAVMSLHGGMDTSERDRRIDDFRNARCKVLIATNVLARGLDVTNVNVVINYDLPTTAQGMPDTEAYLHRVGRTGRFGRMGVTVSFVHSERCFNILRTVADTYACDFTRLPTNSVDEMEEVIKASIKGKRPAPTTTILRGAPLRQEQKQEQQQQQWQQQWPSSSPCDPSLISFD
ncbi:RNA helicase required for poly(A+) mRNA export [Actinomortierella ambigua]|nr:RNA helicase required for poly(A+) mRNA export [Actinomortierella ambigua]